MHSCIYHGHVRHRRFQPLIREFRYSISYLYVDLDEWSSLVRKLPGLGSRRLGLASLCRGDHWGDPGRSLDSSIRDLVSQEASIRIDGPIRLLTLWRSLGFYFSPVNFYFCYSAQQQVRAIVAEVTNTPWRERYAYVLGAHNQTDSAGRQFVHPKRFHVSPFLDLNLEYRWRVTHPDDALSMHLEVCDASHPKFDATLSLRRRSLTTWSWLATIARYPCVPARVLAGIHWEALRLWMNKVPFYPHPSKRSPEDNQTWRPPVTTAGRNSGSAER